MKKKDIDEKWAGLSKPIIFEIKGEGALRNYLMQSLFVIMENLCNELRLDDKEEKAENLWNGYMALKKAGASVQRIFNWFSMFIEFKPKDYPEQYIKRWEGKQWVPFQDDMNGKRLKKD